MGWASIVGKIAEILLPFIIEKIEDKNKKDNEKKVDNRTEDEVK